MKKVAIVQSNYIPWKGYFDLIAAVEEFILYDDMQYTRRDWRNRNLIKTPNGTQWLTVPVQVKGKYHQKIRDTRIDGTSWAREHWQTLRHNYQRAAHFDDVAAVFEPLYLAYHDDSLSAMNRKFIEAVCGFLGIDTKISNSWDYSPATGKSERLADLCAQCGASHYLSGPTAAAYLDAGVFTGRGITVSYFDYDHYPEYPQLWGKFVHQVSIMDLLFNCGPQAVRYMKFGGQP